MPRYPRTILVACPVPWDEREELLETTFRASVRRVIADGFRDLYIFGTGGEGYAVDTRRFRQVVDVFREETAGEGLRPMVGVIGLSTANVVERLRYAHDIGFRRFQFSFPAWGALHDDEVERYVMDVCGAFPDSVFLHYNLRRSGRLMGGRDYARLVSRVPNLVASKSTGGGRDGVEELITGAPELQHFLSETDLPAGSQVGECSLLASYAHLAPERTRRLFEACGMGDRVAMGQLQHEFQVLAGRLWACTSPGPHMDGAFDKMLVRLGVDERFPLRLLSPYTGFSDADYRACRALLETDLVDWARPA
jgi:dihydrodipicolinate synthase/N-acetylneuraminate lyase